MRKPAVVVVFIVLRALTSLNAADQNPVTGQPRPWVDYRTIMWVGDSAFKDPAKVGLFHQRLREIGINTSMVYGGGDPRPIVEHGFPYYVENIINRGLCLKWNSRVTDWDKFVTDWARENRPENALVRDYCLDNPQWTAWARSEMQQVVERNRKFHPAAYDIRDELSTTVSANPFDYDFSPQSLAAFRDWLRTRYTSLAALNTQWETRFTSWDEVKPFTTDAIKNRMASGDAIPRGKPDWQALQRLHFEPTKARLESTRWNFSPWADFRTYMDIALARTLNELRLTARALDPETPVGVEGTQMPHAFGGYDLWRLSQALDWVEPYDIGNAREIFGSFMRGKPLLTTVFESDAPHASRRLWHLLLEGDRGCIVWWSEDCFDWNASDCALTAKARALAPVLRQMTSPLARLFMLAERERDPIFIHYSQPSIQTAWLLESTVDGSTWLRRFSSSEAEHSKITKARNGWLKAFQDLGYSPQFVSSAQLESGVLNNTPGTVLVLPTSWALSAAELGAITSFLQNTPKPLAGRLFFNGTPGLFDEHGKLRVEAPFGRFHMENPASVIAVCSNSASTAPWQHIERYPAERLKPKPPSDLTAWLQGQLGNLPRNVILPAEARVRTHRFRAGPYRLLAFERNIDYHMSEDLKQAGGNEVLEASMEVTAKLPAATHLYDLRKGDYLGFRDEIRFRLDPWEPSLFAATEKKLPDGDPVRQLCEGLPQGVLASPR